MPTIGVLVNINHAELSSNWFVKATVSRQKQPLNEKWQPIGYPSIICHSRDAHGWG